MAAMPAFRVVILEAVGPFAVNNRHIEHTRNGNFPAVIAKRNQFIRCLGSIKPGEAALSDPAFDGKLGPKYRQKYRQIVSQ